MNDCYVLDPVRNARNTNISKTQLFSDLDEFNHHKFI